MEQEKKQQLIEALKVERNNFKAKGLDTTDHDLAIDYLTTGKTRADSDKYDLLEAAMFDLETLYSDYC